MIQKSIEEAEVGLTAECQNYVSEFSRLSDPNVDLDGKAKVNGKTVWCDIKAMIDFKSLKDKGIDISHYPPLEQVAFKMGKDSVGQKYRFLNANGPVSASDVIHICSFKNIQDIEKIPALIEAVLNGAEAAGMSNPDSGFIFIK